MNLLFLKIKKNATLDAVSEQRHLLEKALGPVIHQVPIRHQLLLCFSEYATNIVLHSESTFINLHFGRDCENWWLKIFDNGSSWDPTHHNETLPIDFELDESGRGTSILHSQCLKMKYSANVTGDDPPHNCLKLYWSMAKSKSLSNILLVDDDQSLLRIYSAYLKGSFNVISASSGEDALRVIKTNNIDLVLSDINMPKMNGFALREQLNKLPNSALTPFIFLTGNECQDLQKDATNLGIDDYLVKPASKTQLINTIDRVLSRSQQIYQQLTDRINQSITASLQPKLPDVVHNWRLCVAKRHTGIGGGDLLMYHNGTSHIKLVLIDIMGHDDNAKFFAHAYGGYLRGLLQSSESNITPSALLERLSNSAIEDELFSQITLTCCAMDLLDNGKLTLASAAHPPPLHITQANGVMPLSIGGMLPGLIPDANYESLSLQLAIGERLALFTDGLFDSAADNNARIILEKKVTTTLSDTLEIPIEDALEEVMNVFDDLTVKQPQDDALLVLVEPNNTD